MHLKDKLWIWGHDAGAHNTYKIPKLSIAGPLEGAVYLGIPNMCRIVYGGKPKPPFDQQALLLDSMKRVVWSIVGDTSSDRNDHGNADVEAVGRVAKNHPNIIGGILDDFLNPKRRSQYPPELLIQYKESLSEYAGRKMELWTVIYTHELDESIIPYLNACDVATLWTWASQDLSKLTKNLQHLRSLWGNKPILGGCYLWEYSKDDVMPQELLQYQLDMYYRWMLEGMLHGVVFCSNNMVDVGLESVEYVKQWIHIHENEKLN